MGLLYGDEYNDNYVITIQYNNIISEEEMELKHNPEKEPDLYIEELRLKQQEFYDDINKEMISKLQLYSGVVSYSQFSPFIQIEFDNIDEYLQSSFKLDDYLHNENVVNIYLDNSIQIVEDYEVQ